MDTVTLNRVTHTTLPDGPAIAPQVKQGNDFQKENDVSPNPEDKEQARKLVVSRIVRKIYTPDGSS